MAKSKKVSFSNIVNGPDYKAPVEKSSADVFEFEYPGNGAPLRRKDPMLDQPGGNPKSTDATREPMYSPTQFTADGAKIVDRNADVDGVRPPTPYEHRDADSGWNPFATPDPFLNFRELGADGGAPRPANFQAPTPGRNPADGPAAVRLGNDYVVSKSEDDVTAFDPKVSFANITGSPFAPVAKALTVIEKARQARPAILKNACATLIEPASNAAGQTIGYVVKVEGESSPLFKSRFAAEKFLAAEILKATGAPADEDRLFLDDCGRFGIHEALNRARMQEDDPLASHLNAGNTAELADEANNASGQPLGDPEKVKQRLQRSKAVRLF
jgi:hypothetical protein